MRVSNKKEITESGKIMALTVILMKLLLLVIAGGIFWLIQFVISQQNQLDSLFRGFMPY